MRRMHTVPLILSFIHIQLENIHVKSTRRVLFYSFLATFSFPFLCLMMKNFMCVTVVEAGVYHFFLLLRLLFLYMRRKKLYITSSKNKAIPCILSLSLDKNSLLKANDIILFSVPFSRTITILIRCKIHTY